MRASIIRICLLLLLIVMYCSANAQKKSFPGFEEKIWKRDSMGCLGLRSKYHLGDLIYCNRTKIVGVSMDCIVSFLGKPCCGMIENLEEVTIFSYFLNSGVQCLPTGESNDVRSLSIFFKNDVVERVAITNGSTPQCE